MDSEDKKRYGVIENDGKIETTHTIVFENGKSVLKEKIKIKQGKLSRAAGSRFELKVRKYWEDKSFIVDKWSNNVDLNQSKIVSAKRKYNPFKKVMVIGTGFPDLIVFQFIRDGIYDVFGVEVKMNGLLSKEEKEKCWWYLENKVFSKILVAKKSMKKGTIEFIDFGEKWNRKISD